MLLLHFIISLFVLQVHLIRKRRLGDVFVPANNHLEKGSESAPEFCIDAGSTGNVDRFINHSCEPNLFVQSVFTSYHDVRFARTVLVNADNVPPLQVTLFSFFVSYFLSDSLSLTLDVRLFHYCMFFP